MKEYRKAIIIKNKVNKVYCNSCGKEIKGDYLAVEKAWGYFSASDGQTHSFDLCEDCYNSLISTFKIPAEKN